MAQWLSELSVGQWYQSDGSYFEIVGVDADAETVLVQYFDGSLDDIDFEHWVQSDFRECAPPEDYSGAMDMDGLDYPEKYAERGAAVRHPRWLDELDSEAPGS